MRYPIVASREDIERLFEQACAALEDIQRRRPYEDPREWGSIHDRRRIFQGVAEAFRYCCVAAGDLGDPTLLPLIASAIEKCQRFGDDIADDRTVMGWSLTRLLHAGAPFSKEVQRLAAQKDSRLRYFVASGLKPCGPGEIAALQALAADAEPSVREAAKETLSEVQEVPWWSGKFDSDPAARLLPGELERSREALATISELLDEPRHNILGTNGSPDELLAQVTAVPDILAVEVLEKLCGSLEFYFMPQSGPLLSHLLSREGGAAAFDRLLDTWGKKGDVAAIGRDVILGAVREASPPVRREVAEARLRQLAALPHAARLTSYKNPAATAAAVVAAAWPPGEDISPVMDVLLQLAEEHVELVTRHESDCVVGGLRGILARPDVDTTAVEESLIEARLQGYPGKYGPIGGAADALLSRLDPGRLRAIAERAIDTDNPETVKWSLERLLDEAFDPARDGDPIERVGDLFAHPRLREIIIGDGRLSERAFCPLRAALRRGELEYPIAVSLFQSIGSLYGGVEPLDRPVIAPLEMDEDVDAIALPAARQARRLEKRTELQKWLGPEDLRGAPSPDEWERLKEARARHTFEGLKDEARLWGRALVEGPLTTEERAELERFFESYRGGAEELGHPLMPVLLAKADAATIHMMDEIASRTRGVHKQYYEGARDRVRERLGLPPAPAAPRPAERVDNPDDAAAGDADW